MPRTFDASRRTLCLMAATSACVGATARADGTGSGDDAVQVWVDLTEPVADGDRRQAARVAAQQQQVSDALRALGAVELARVRQAHNAIAVRLPRGRLADAAALPGVRRVRPAVTLHPPKTMD
jgi:glutamate/tyrosine decarboxylase-like PLP-dependent enzyme